MQASRLAFLSIILLAAIADSAGAPASGGKPACPPLETRAANAPDQRPAFPGQTRACAIRSNVAFDVVVLAKGLERPWAAEPLPGGDLLVTEKPGRMRIVSAQGEVGQPINGVPPVDARGQGGLLDVALSPTFQADRTIYWSYAEPRRGGNGTAVARGVLSADRRSLEQVRVILRVIPTYDGDKHYGSRLAFGPDGLLYVTTGERSDAPMRKYAQQFDSHLGKVLRIRPDGSAPADNPYAGQPNALPEIWTLGHRNIQAAAFDSNGQFWVVEHGTRGGDELNLIEKGKNYGWPLVAYGVDGRAPLRLAAGSRAGNGSGDWAATLGFALAAPGAVAPRFGTALPPLTGHDPAFKYRADLMRGNMTMTEFGLYNWRGGGSMWFAPVSQARGSETLKQIELATRILNAHGLDYVGEFIVTRRAMHHIIDVLYDRTDEEEMKRAHACFAALLDEFENHGYGVYRVNNAFMDRVAEAYGPVQRNFNRTLKRALDPNGIFAPGKSGIDIG
jgi:glucose/arabinose dehydrogenase